MNTHLPHSTYDVIIAGARIAGSSLAMLLARAGLRVLVIDRSAEGLDTVSTHALMRAGVMLLHDWNVLDRIRNSDTPAIRKTTFHYGQTPIPVAIKEKGGVDALYAPRRTVIDPILVEAAREAGAHFLFRSSLRSLIFDADGRVTGAEIFDLEGNQRIVRANWVIGADGVESTVAREAGAAMEVRAQNYGAVIYGYFDDLDIDGTHWFYGDCTGAGAIPTSHGQACVFVSGAPGRFAARKREEREMLFHHLVRETNPEFAESLARARLSGRLLGFSGRPGFLRCSHGAGWALVGDAGCFKDPITAHGMTDALRDAASLARALIEGTPEALTAHATRRNQFAREFIALSDRVASYNWTREELQSLHRDLSKLMNMECDHIEALRTQPLSTSRAIAAAEVRFSTPSFR